MGKFEELLSRPIEQPLLLDEIDQIVKEIGLDKITKRQLDQIIGRYGSMVFANEYFNIVYSLKAADESNKVMKCWTIITGIMTIVVTIATVLK